MVSVRLVWPFLEFARSQGHDVSAVANRLGITQRELENPATRVMQKLVAELLDVAVDSTGTRDIGLIAAQLTEARHFGLGEYIARTQPTLGCALRAHDRYLPLLSDAAGVSLDYSRTQLIVRPWLSPELAMHEVAHEFAVASGVLRARRITGRNELAPMSVHFMHPQPSSIKRHAEIFRCPVFFCAEATHVVICKRSLAFELPGSEPALNAILTSLADSTLSEIPRRGGWIGRIQALLGAQLSLSDVTLTHLARRFGVSARTLSRRLEFEGTSFREILDNARRQAALRELSRRETPIDVLSARLGYASSQAFHRAFKRWTGTTPARTRTSTRKQMTHARRAG